MSMKKIDLGKIEQVDVREIWDKEDTDFTPLLAQEENIERLGLALGIDLIVERQYLNSTIGTLLNVLLKKPEAQAKQESNVQVDRSLQSAS